MFNRLEKMIRHYWHDLYYFFASDKGVDFAMTCREATEKIDLRDQAKTTNEKIRVQLHVSLCQACNNYNQFSRILNKALKKVMSLNARTQSEITKLNEALLRKFSK